MPFVEVKTPVKFNDEQMSLMQMQLLDIVSEEMGKGVDTIMIGIKDKYRLSIGRKVISKGAFVNVKAFKNSTVEAKKLVSVRITEVMVKDFDFEQDSIYITFDDQDVWGYKGDFLS